MKKANSFIIMTVLISSFPLMMITSTKDAKACPWASQKILVLASGNDSMLLRKMEEHLTKRLQDLGYTSFSAIHQYGQDAFRSVREEETLKQLYTYDAVMTISLLNKGNETCCRSRSDSNNFFWEYYDDIHTRINTPRYYTERGKYYWEADFFDLCNWQLKYSMQTNHFEPALTYSLLLKNGDIIIDDMIANNIVQRSLKPF